MSHIDIPVDNTINLLVYYQLLPYFLAHQQVLSFLKSQRFLSRRFLFDLFLEHSFSTLSNLSMPAIQACSSPPIELSNNQQIHPYSPTPSPLSACKSSPNFSVHLSISAHFNGHFISSAVWNIEKRASDMRESRMGGEQKKEDLAAASSAAAVIKCVLAVSSTNCWRFNCSFRPT